MGRQFVHDVTLWQGTLVSTWLHTEVNPDDAGFEQAAREVQRAKRSHGVAPEQLRLLVVTDGGAPNLKQRGLLESVVYEGHRTPMAVVTTVLSNPIKRGIATALSWVNPSIGFFEPAQRDAALAHVGLQPLAVQLDAKLQTMAGGLPPNVTLARWLAAGVGPRPMAPGPG